MTEFPDPGETRLEREPGEEFAGVRAWGAAFEALRDEPVDQHVFLATLGPVAAHTARASYVSHLLAAGGVDVDVAGATRDPAELVAAYAGQPVVCLAGTDGAYDDWGADAIAALRGAGAQWVVVAGRKRDDVDDSCALGVDAVDFLTRTRAKLNGGGLT